MTLADLPPDRLTLGVEDTLGEEDTEGLSKEERVGNTFVRVTVKLFVGLTLRLGETEDERHSVGEGEGVTLTLLKKVDLGLLDREGDGVLEPDTVRVTTDVREGQGEEETEGEVLVDPLRVNAPEELGEPLEQTVRGGVAVEHCEPEGEGETDLEGTPVLDTVPEEETEGERV